MRKWYMVGMSMIVLVMVGFFLVYQKQPSQAVQTLQETGVNTSYDVELDVNPEDLTIDGNMTVHTLNNTEKDHESIFFHLYANAFTESYNKDNEFWNEMLGRFSEPGNIDIHEVKINNQKADFTVDQTLLEIPVQWNQDEVAQIEIDFTINIPFNNTRMSYNGNSYWMGNSLPIQAVYDQDTGWHKDPYYALGEPFHSETSNYNVSITTPEDHKVASTGKQVASTEHKESGTITYDMHAEKVRDFVYVILDDTVDYIESTVGDTIVRTWYINSSFTKDDIQKYHEAGEKSLKYFNEKFGEYPFDEYDIVGTGGWFGGMEYPGLVFISQRYFKNDYGILTTVHETAHQWWYSLVGSNPVKHAWMDESLASYSELQFVEEFYPEINKKYNGKDYEEAKQLGEFAQDEQYISSTVPEFKSSDAYFTLIYSIGSQMFNYLEEEVGTENINRALATYFEENQYENAKPEDLLRAFEEEIGPDARKFLESWLNGNRVKLEDVQ